MLFWLRFKDALKQADQLLLATDEDREGESISWHVLQVLEPEKAMPVGRIVFHEVTPEAIDAALKNPRSVDENLARAQEARRILDQQFSDLVDPHFTASMEDDPRQEELGEEEPGEVYSREITAKVQGGRQSGHESGGRSMPAMP